MHKFTTNHCFQTLCVNFIVIGQIMTKRRQVKKDLGLSPLLVSQGEHSK